MIRAILLAPALVLILLAGIYLLTPQVALDIPAPPEGYLDGHADIMGIGAGGSGCFVADEISESHDFRLDLSSLGVTLEELKAQGDELIPRRMDTLIAKSKYVHRAVLPALDGVVRDGALDRSATRVYVPNEFVSRMARQYSHLEFGASVNPERPDWLERLEQSRKDGAVLVHWAPAAMRIDPANVRYVPYYRALVDLGLPLLVRIGRDGPSGSAEANALGDPRRLSLPLREGVTVVATHIAATEEYDGVAGYQRLLQMFSEYPNLYADTSGLSRFTKVGYLVDALKTPDLRARLLYASDWSRQSFPWTSPFYHWPDVGLARAKTIQNVANVWDRDLALKLALGVPPAALQRSAGLLGQ